MQRLSQEDGVNLAGIKRIIELENQVEALQGRVAELTAERDTALVEAAHGRRYRPGVDAARPRPALAQRAGRLETTALTKASPVPFWS